MDALDGRCVIGSDDLVLTRAGKPDEYVLLVPSWREACSAWPSTPTVPGCSSSNRHESSEANVEAVAVFLSSNAAPSEDLLAWGTGLEQTLALLRHKGAANLADVRAERSARAVTALEGTAEGTLLGLLERERADALRLLSTDLGGNVPNLVAAHLRAATRFREVGLAALAARTRHLLSAAAPPGQAALPLPGLPARPRLDPSQRVAYCTERVLALRVPLAAEGTCKPAAPGTPVLRERVGEPRHLPPPQLVEWLARVRSRRLRPWWDLSHVGAAAAVRVRAGLDAELSVALGLGGQTGPKAGQYLAEIRAPGYDVSPDFAVGTVGEPTEFIVNRKQDGASPIVLDLRTPLGEIISVMLSPTRAQTPQ